MIIHRIRNKKEYDEYKTRNSASLEKHVLYLSSVLPNDEKEFYVPGYSYTAKKQVNFIVDFQHSGQKGQVNWRERVCCPETYFNNRMRATFHLFDFEMDAYSDGKIYITEQVTPIYTYFADNFSDIVGSEYIGDKFPYGKKNDEGVRNEDLTALTFEDESFDILISLDVLEHIPDYNQAFK